MPDFGYGQDNYLIKEDIPNKWNHLIGLLEDNQRFAWLMNYLMLDKLEKQVKKDEDNRNLLKEMRAKMRKERRVKFETDMQPEKPRDPAG